MAGAKNKAVSRRFIEEVWNRGNLDAIEELVAPDFENHDPANPDLGRGPAGVRRLVERYRTAFPAVRLTVEDQIAEGNRVVTRWTARGTHEGELLGIPPSRRPVEVAGITIDRIENGRMVESWSNWDALGMMQRIGAVPERVPAGG